MRRDGGVLIWESHCSLVGRLEIGMGESAVRRLLAMMVCVATEELHSGLIGFLAGRR